MFAALRTLNNPLTASRTAPHHAYASRTIGERGGGGEEGEVGTPARSYPSCQPSRKTRSSLRPVNIQPAKETVSNVFPNVFCILLVARRWNGEEREREKIFKFSTTVFFPPLPKHYRLYYRFFQLDAVNRLSPLFLSRVILPQRREKEGGRRRRSRGKGERGRRRRMDGRRAHQ